MKEPILSREEVEALAHRICMKYVHSDNEYLRQYTFGMLTLEQFAQAYEAALLEKLCWELVAWRAPNLSGSGGAWAYRDADDRFEDQHCQPVGELLYTINRSKA
ncbi:conserved hypothetical protein [Burkholderia diffusa]|uniref:hypothetical protein n=1 Tax=Burkholderia diffusa TaxID=488732 RepID=UPI001CAE98FB|nr:hypothetical protein [Burkholderia diffusa]CAG9259504.1 conserved hypothetical protein [Burkholderia diffusa]